MCELPSRCERNVTPSSVTLRSSLRLKTWKPPESVSRARGQLMKRCSPLHAPDGLVAGAQIQMIGVAENDLGAQRLEHVLRNGFDGALRAHGHEDRRFDGLVGQVDAPAPAAGGSFCKEIEPEAHFSILSG